MTDPALIQRRVEAHVEDLRRTAAEPRRLDSNRTTAPPQERRSMRTSMWHLTPATSSGDMTPSSTPRLQSYTRANTPGVIDLLAAEGWDTYTGDVERTARALLAPGCTTLLALDGARVVALVQLQSDGEIQAHLSALLVATAWRRRGLARQLLCEALTRAGGIHIDVLTRNRAFYQALGGKPRPGFRLTPEQLNPHTQLNAASATLPVAAIQP